MHRKEGSERERERQEISKIELDRDRDREMKKKRVRGWETELEWRTQEQSRWPNSLEFLHFSYEHNLNLMLHSSFSTATSIDYDRLAYDTQACDRNSHGPVSLNVPPIESLFPFGGNPRWSLSLSP